MVNNIDEVISEKLVTLTLAITKLQEINIKNQINNIETDNKDFSKQVGGKTSGATCLYCGGFNYLATQCT